MSDLSRRRSRDHDGLGLVRPTRFAKTTGTVPDRRALGRNGRIPTPRRGCQRMRSPQSRAPARREHHSPRPIYSGLSRVPQRCGRPVAWPTHLPVEGKAVKNRHGRAAVTGWVLEMEPRRAQKRHWQVTDRGRPTGKAGSQRLESEDRPGRFTASAALPTGRRDSDPGNIECPARSLFVPWPWWSSPS